MSRIRIEMPEQFSFITETTVRIRDINYGGHLDNAAVLSLLHEARVRYLKSLECTELDACGISLIMTDVAVEYKNEGFHNDRLRIQIAVSDLSSRGFSLFYRVTCLREHKEIVVALAQTGMLCFNYDTRKVSYMPEALKLKLEGKTQQV